jgi:SRSO17 transposase
VVYRSKWHIALEQIRRARGNGVRFAWLTFDEWYGGKPPFLRELSSLGQNYVGEVPVDFAVWTQRPAVRYPPADTAAPPGSHRLRPRLKKQHNPKVQVRNVAAYSPLFRREDWHAYRVKDGTKGPMVWHVKRILVYLEDEHGLPTAPHHLLVAINAQDPLEVKYFLSNAPPGTPIETLLLVAFSRWKIERLFEHGKSALGLDHFEVRTYLSIQRHLILSGVSYLFLAEFHQRHRGEKSGVDALPDPHGDGDPGAAVASWRTVFQSPGPSDPARAATHPSTHR